MYASRLRVHGTMLHVRQGCGHYGLRGRCELFTRELLNSARRRSRSHWRPGGAAVGQTYQARGKRMGVEGGGRRE